MNGGKPSDSRISIKKRENWKRILMVGKPHHPTVATVASYKKQKMNECSTNLFFISNP